jgi:hypothetical protein
MWAPQTNFVAAYSYASNEVPTQSINGLTASQTFLGNTVYSSAPSTNVTSTAGITLTFDAQNNSSEVFIMQIPGSLTIDGPITFNLMDGALASNIYWIVAAATTISPSGLPVTWDGDILTQTSFTMSANTGGSGVLAGTINGCIFAETASSLAGETDVEGCSSASVTPEPGSAGLAVLGCLLGAFCMRIWAPINQARHALFLRRLHHSGAETGLISWGEVAAMWRIAS